LKQKGFLFFTRKSASILTKKLGNGKHPEQGSRTVMAAPHKIKLAMTVSLSSTLPYMGERDLGSLREFHVIRFCSRPPEAKIAPHPFSNKTTLKRHTA
jgi:hypothetical protein